MTREQIGPIIVLGAVGIAMGAYGALPGAMARIEFFARCAALEDLAFAIESGRHEYAANAERTFGYRFPQRA
jgi:hypothetical protein